MLTAIELRNILFYDPMAGHFLWLVGHARARMGSRAGCANGLGYWHIGIKGRKYKASRLAWLYMTGEWPSTEIDHKNRNRMDDRWENLRLATRSQNVANRAGRRKEGLPKGVLRKNGRFRARIYTNRKEQHLGTFDTPEQAGAAYQMAAAKLHGEFAAQG